MPLPAWLCSNDDVDQPVGGHGNLGALIRRPDGGLNVVGQTKPEQLAVVCGFAATCLEASPIGGAHCKIHVCRVLTAVVGRPYCIGVWHCLRRNEILAA